MRSEVREAWFIRHGESLANAGLRTKNTQRCPLTELGFLQAEQCAMALAKLPAPECIVASPYLRAWQTAEPTWRIFPEAIREEWPVQEVQYLDAAACVDTTQGQRQTLAEVYWEQCDPLYTAPGAESFVAFIGRAKAAIERLAARTEKRIYLFSHGHFMSALAWVFLTRPSTLDAVAMRRYYQFIHGYTVANCAVMPLYFHPDGTHSLGSLWVPDGVESIRPTGDGLAGL